MNFPFNLSSYFFLPTDISHDRLCDLVQSCSAWSRRWPRTLRWMNAFLQFKGWMLLKLLQPLSQTGLHLSQFSLAPLSPGPEPRAETLSHISQVPSFASRYSSACKRKTLKWQSDVRPPLLKLPDAWQLSKHSLMFFTAQRHLLAELHLILFMYLFHVLLCLFSLSSSFLCDSVDAPCCLWTSSSCSFVVCDKRRERCAPMFGDYRRQPMGFIGVGEVFVVDVLFGNAY